MPDRRLLIATLAALSACADGSATPTEAPDRPQAPPAAARQASPAGPSAADYLDQELRLSHRNLDFLVTGDLEGEDPAGMGIYLERPAGIGLMPMGLTVAQDGRNLWGTGLDEDSGDPYPDWVAVFQSSVGDVFRFREGGRAILGNGVGRPEPHHVLTVQDRENGFVQNVLNLYAGPSGNATRYVRGFNGEGIDFSVARGGRTGLGKDHDPRLHLDVAGDARARRWLQVEEPDQVINVQEVLNVLDDVTALVPLRYTPVVGEATPRYGLLDTSVHDALFPETVYRDPVDGTRSVDYAQMTTLLVAAVKELTARVEALEGGKRVGAVPNLCQPPERRRPGGAAGAPSERTGAR